MYNSTTKFWPSTINSTIVVCNVIDKKKCRWSKFRRTVVRYSYGRNLNGLAYSCDAVIEYLFMFLRYTTRTKGTFTYFILIIYFIILIWYLHTSNYQFISFYPFETYIHILFYRFWSTSFISSRPSEMFTLC